MILDTTNKTVIYDNDRIKFNIDEFIKKYGKQIICVSFKIFN